MKKLIFTLLCACTSLAQAQDLTIRYDFINDKYTYFHGNREISQPLIRRNYEVRVVVDNLNPFVFMARCGWKEEVVQDNSSVSGIATMFTGAGLSTSGLGSIMGMINPEEAVTRGESRTSSSLHRDEDFAKLAFDNCKQSFKNLQQAEQALIRMELSTAKLKQLKYNPYLPADSLKNIAQTMVEQCFKTGNPNWDRDFNANAFMDYGAMLTNVINKETENLRANGSDYVNYYKQYMANHTSFDEMGLDVTVNDMISSALKLKTAYIADSINSRLERLEQQYEVIRFTPFEYVCNYMARGDMLSLTLEFFELNKKAREEGYTVGMANPDTLRKIRTKTMNIIVRGDIKISTSVGLGFPTYFKANQTFTNPDTMITSVAGNNFSPCLATYINFYPYQGRNAHWGGTFGVGIPVQGDNTGNLNFFLGVSSILGANSKVVLNAGLAVGQNQVLDKGQKVGDKLPYNTDPATKKAFKTGAFFGISFAISK